MVDDEQIRGLVNSFTCMLYDMQDKESKKTCLNELNAFSDSLHAQKKEENKRNDKSKAHNNNSSINDTESETSSDDDDDDDDDDRIAAPLQTLVMNGHKYILYLI